MKTPRIGMLIAIASACTLAPSAGRCAIPLVQDGRPAAVIVVPGDKPSLAALELQEYVEKTSGAKLEILAEEQLAGRSRNEHRIFVGPCSESKRIIDVSAIEPEGFVIKSEGSDLHIVGRDATEAGLPVLGTYYGVCEFLERFLGVRWVMPTRLGEIAPRRATIEIPVTEIRQAPLLWQRKIRDCKMGGHQDRIVEILKEWGAPLGAWRSEFSRERTGPWFRRQRLGARVRLQYGHSYGGWWDRYHEQYPDIFALQPDGTRVNTSERERLCVSNPTLWDLVAKEKVAQLSRDPNLTAASVSPNDGGANKFCRCERCRAWDSPEAQAKYEQDPASLDNRELSLTDRYFRFYNEVARRVYRETPNRYLGAYAYSIYRDPPVVLDQLEPNLIVGYVGFSSYLSDSSRARDRESWTRWSELASQLFLRPNLLWGPLGFPVNYSHKLAEDLRFLADRGMRAVDFDGLIGNWGTQGLDYYVLAKLLWNPSTDVDEIIDDYCRAAYGAGGPAMKSYYARLEKLTNQIAARTEDGQFNRWRDTHLLAQHYNDGALADLQADLDRAAAAIGDSTDASAQRVQLVADGLQYARRTRDLLLAAESCRARTGSRDQFERVKSATMEYYKSLALSWAVAVDHDYSYVRRGLSIRPRP